jgi:hypothetical protein
MPNARRGNNTMRRYRHYATLYFVFAVDHSESQLGILDLIQVFVESLDNCFKNVCELDIIFNSEVGEDVCGSVSGLLLLLLCLLMLLPFAFAPFPRPATRPHAADFGLACWMDAGSSLAHA